MNKSLVLLLAALIFVGCSRTPVEETVADPDEQQIARAEAAADALLTDLAGHLVAGLNDSGPLKTIEVCAEEAQVIAAGYSSEDLTVRRVSLEVRNPLDAPDSWETERLLELAELAKQYNLPHRLVEVVETEAGRELRYLKPLTIAPPCLNCHGDPEAMSEDVLAKLAELYPGDQALGYQVGDLRGAVSVRMALPSEG